MDSKTEYFDDEASFIKELVIRALKQEAKISEWRKSHETGGKLDNTKKNLD